MTTMFEYLKNPQLPLEELAKELVVWQDEFEMYVCTDGIIFRSEEEELAIEHEIQWLKSEA